MSGPRWFVLLALIGCGDAPQQPDTITVSEPDPAEEGSLRIATTPDPTAIARAAVIEAPLPSGEPIVRDCFGLGERSRKTTSGPNRQPRARPRPSMAPMGGAPAPEAAPAAPSAGSGTAPADLGRRGSGIGGGGIGIGSGDADGTVVGGVFGWTGGEGGGGKAARSDAPASASDRSEPAPDIARNVRELQAQENLADEEDPNRRSSREATEGEIATKGEQARDGQERGPTYDWGAEIYLSNDDSMSLASAQRVLFALSRGVPLSPGEVRPHELLNYFSFDSVAPASDRTFGVLGAAEQDGDKLTVSLAVRGANPPRQPLDLTVLLDRSCSMAAEGRMDYTRRGLSQLAGNLQRGDRIDVTLFDSGVCTPLENFVVGRDDPSLLDDIIANLQPTSSTDLDAGLREAYRIQTSRSAGDVHGRNRRVLLVTDAELNTGNVSESLVSEVGRNLDEHGVKLSGIGVGRDFNDHMLDMLTEKGRGAYVYLGSEAVVDRIFGPGFDSLVRTVAHDVQFSLDLPDSLAMARFYGEEASTNAEDVKPIHYHAGTTQLFLQDLAIHDGKLVESDPITMKIRYRDALTMEPVTEELRTTVGALLDADPHNLRKGRALMAFSDWVMAGTLGGDPCGEPLSAYRQRASTISDDAEIGFVNGLVGGRCGVQLATVVSGRPGVDLKVKVDADIPIAEVELECNGRTHLEKISGSDTVARFGSVQPGICTVRLQGTTPMAARVEVPEAGGDLRCMIRGGRVSCG